MKSVFILVCLFHASFKPSLYIITERQLDNSIFASINFFLFNLFFKMNRVSQISITVGRIKQRTSHFEALIKLLSLKCTKFVSAKKLANLYGLDVIGHRTLYPWELIIDDFVEKDAQFEQLKEW